MSYLLDTNICVHWLRSGPGELARRLVALAPDNRILLCSVVKAELIFGAHRSPRPIEQSLRLIATLFADLDSLAFDDAAAEVYGDIRSHLTRQGKSIGPNDLMIAAIALANDLTLVTHNTREFSRVPGLVLEDWEAIE